MSAPLVRLEGVSKRYPRVHHPSERFRAFASLLMGREPRDGAQVLTDISLEVRPGESLGIIGENGAGKSTLLKVLTGVIRPSSGEVAINARTAALLELGAGFQPDFSGLDNVRMNATLLGMSTREVEERLDDILAFADIGEAIHEPVKHYSSGMVVRLGFAIVASSRPELLITDEVLAVGDESFQKKCIRWIEAFLGNGGTLLMVSHSMWLVQKLCQHALWIHDGRCEQYGDVFAVTQGYLAWHEERSAREKAGRDAATGDAGEYHVAKLDFPGHPADEPPVIETGGDLDIELEVASPDGRAPGLGIGVILADGTGIYGVTSATDGAAPTRLDNGRYGFRFRFTGLQLLPGSYSVRAHAMDPEGLRVFDTRERPFRVRGATLEVGIVRCAHEWLD